jgi:hypothetical protein
MGRMMYLEWGKDPIGEQGLRQRYFAESKIPSMSLGIVEPPPGLEPGTDALRKRCSTD